MMGRREFCLGAAGVMTLTGPRAEAGERLRAIDTHAHVFLKSLPAAPGRRYTPDYDAPTATYLKMLADNRIDRGVLVQPSFLGVDNSYLTAALVAHRDKLRGIAVVAENTGVKELAKLKQAGVVGIRLNLIGQPTPDFTTPGWKIHLARVAALGWLVEVQAEAARLPAIAPTILAAGLRLVVDHFGRPDATLGIADPGFRYLLDLGRGGDTWVKLSGTYRLAPGERGRTIAREAAAVLHDHFGSSRLMWGSDWPHTQFEKVTDYLSARAALDVWFPNARERRHVLLDTPRKLFGFR